VLQDRLPSVVALVVFVAFAGCGSHATTPTPPGPDMAVNPTGVPCADVKCAPCADQFCDTADYGITGTCEAHVAATNQSFGCDGPEDCGGGLAACCYFDSIGAACSAAGCGSTARHMCHQVSECAAGESCCPLAAGTTYSVCTTNSC
jgi:hypothetical protein